MSTPTIVGLVLPMLIAVLVWLWPTVIGPAVANRRHRAVGWHPLLTTPREPKGWSKRWDSASGDIRGGLSWSEVAFGPDSEEVRRCRADRDWLEAQRELCEAEPAEHSSWWETGRG